MGSHACALIEQSRWSGPQGPDAGRGLRHRRGLVPRPLRSCLT